ncbi:MAG: hypothetical protein GC189_05870 [Alphaproteobacteria bacterium]|nr:hypothetical protein [Alphaproteobacteria bacterium]
MRRWAIAAAAVCMFASACTPAAFRRVGEAVADTPVQPDVLGPFNSDAPIDTAQAWSERRAPLLREAFQERVYGRMPAAYAPRILERKPLEIRALGDAAIAEQWTIAVTDDPDPLKFNLVLVTPPNTVAAPLIIAEVFCGNRAATPGRPAAVAEPLTPVMYPCRHGWTDPIAEAVLGRYINGAPILDVIGRGYALAYFYPGDVVADDAELAPAALARLTPPDTPEDQRTGAIAVWAWLFSRAIDAVQADPRIDAARIAVWGHSRHGKAAIVAGAFDERIAAIIAHQSGRGGASLANSEEGETLEQITSEYPHWFAPAFAHLPAAGYPIDQHALLGLIAPRPVLLGNGDHDAWSDPHSAFRAAQAASRVYALFGDRGMTQSAMRTESVEDDLSFFLRPGRHGVTTEDWRLFLQFLDAHLKPDEI